MGKMGKAESRKQRLGEQKFGKLKPEIEKAEDFLLSVLRISALPFQ